MNRNKKAQPEKLGKHSKKIKQLDNNTNQSQRQRLLDWLRSEGTITTIQAREELNIMMPAARIYELRLKDGFNIKTVWTTETTDKGYPHRVARYILSPRKKKGGR